MKDQLRQQVRRVEPTDPITNARRYDYADAFELRLPEQDSTSPGLWVGAGLNSTPKWVDRVAGLVGMSSTPESTTEYAGLFQVVASDPGFIHLETSIPLMDVVLVGRNVEPTRRMLTTTLTYRRPRLARLAWAFIGIGHRRLVPYVLTGMLATS